MHAAVAAHSPAVRPVAQEPIIDPHDILIRKLKEHSRLDKSDVAAIRELSTSARPLAPNEDFIRQGDRPKSAALVLSGIVARYHLLPDGRRQYLSYHLTGDLPDAQGLFVDQMDHAVCAVGPAMLASIPHKDILAMFEQRPSVGFSIWRETLIDAAIFREAITNNSARNMQARMAHLFCEIYYRSRASSLTADNSCALPVSLGQLGETLGMSLATVNRTLSELRETRCLDFRNGQLTIRNWDRAAALGQFDPRYLHLKKPPL